MVRSMTGYGRGEFLWENLSVTVEIKSVNHRFFECSVKAPRQLNFLEDKLKAYIQSRVARGKIDVYVSCDFGSNGADKIEINDAVASQYVLALKELAKKYKLKNDVSVSLVASNNDVFSVKKQSVDEDEALNAVMKSAELAVDAFINARETEGERLANDVLSRVETILNNVSVVEERAPETEKEYRERIESKIKDLLGSANIDEQRIITETAIFADHVAVNEETVRLRSHIAHLKELFADGGVIGKKLDFIIQEMNRETNTIGSKCQNIDIAHIVVDIKSEIEKIREQIQNIE